ncbi:response regulator [Paenibacillus sp. GCM10027626]|uniref:response regulator transcription factor n=1 Tax=Paenibacillus sp. GCM10027626 TaxID=3273411 RepID=UPI003642A528
MRIMLVDDEPLFLDQLKRKLTLHNDESVHSLQIVGECYSGHEAMAQIPSLSPDVVFTDIRMASGDGIELAHAIQKRWPNIQVVVISGYPSFEYAREAMRANVADYLLKPLDADALRDVLDKQLQSFESRHYLRTREVVWGHLCSGRFEEVPQSVIPAALPYSSYRLFLIQKVGAGYDLPFLMPPHLVHFGECRSQLVQLLAHNEEAWLFPIEDGSTVITVIGTHGDGPAAMEQILTCLQNTFRNNNQLPSIAYSEPIREPENLRRTVQKLQVLLSEHIAIGKPKLVTTASSSGLSTARTLSELEVQRIRHLTIKQDYAALKTMIHTSLQTWEKLSLSNKVLKVNLMHILRIIDRTHQPPLDPDNRSFEARVEEMVMTASSYAELFQAFWSMLAHSLSLEQDAEDKINNAAEIFAKIETYISYHIGQPLSLQDLIGNFHVSSTYICSLFRNFSGKSFVEYVTELRMRKAKEFMLAYPEMLVKEIAEIVGYTDQNYFSRVFKTIVGVSPTEFRLKDGYRDQSSGCERS